ncbi:hypothetical protein VPH35_015447 [Triticum aestivum]
MQTDTSNKGKQVVPPHGEGKEVVPTTPEEVATDEDVVQEELLATSAVTMTTTKRMEVQPTSIRVILDHGWAPFATVHQIRIGYMVMFNLLTLDTLKVIIFDDEGIEVVTKCGKHDDAFALNV